MPGSQEIQLSSVSAEYDGTGAGGAFDPTLSVYSQDGQLLSRTKVGSTVAAGGTAVCTWIPFLRQASASGGVAWAKIDSRSTTITVQSSNTLLLPEVTESFSTNDPTVFDEASKVVSGTTYKGVRFLKNGVYWVMVGFNCTGAGAGDTLIGYYTQGGGNTDGFYGGGSDRTSFPTPGFTNDAQWGWIETYQVDPVTSPAPTDPQLFYGRNNGSASGHVSSVAFYQYLGPGLLFP